MIQKFVRDLLLSALLIFLFVIMIAFVPFGIAGLSSLTGLMMTVSQIAFMSLFLMLLFGSVGIFTVVKLWV